MTKIIEKIETGREYTVGTEEVKIKYSYKILGLDIRRVTIKIETFFVKAYRRPLFVLKNLKLKIEGNSYRVEDPNEDY